MATKCRHLGPESRLHQIFGLLTPDRVTSSDGSWGLQKYVCSCGKVVPLTIAGKADRLSAARVKRTGSIGTISFGGLKGRVNGVPCASGSCPTKCCLVCKASQLSLLPSLLRPWLLPQ